LKKPDAFSVMLEAVNSDTTLKTKTQKAEKLVSLISGSKSAASGAGDNTLRAQAGKAVDNSLTFGPIATKYKELLKSDPTGNQAKAYKDRLVLEELQRLKQNVTSSTPGENIVDFNSLG